MDVFDLQGAAVSRNHETTLKNVYILVPWTRGLGCTGNGLSLSFFPYFRTAGKSRNKNKERRGVGEGVKGVS